MRVQFGHCLGSVDGLPAFIIEVSRIDLSSSRSSHLCRVHRCLARRGMGNGRTFASRGKARNPSLASARRAFLPHDDRVDAAKAQRDRLTLPCSRHEVSARAPHRRRSVREARHRRGAPRLQRRQPSVRRQRAGAWEGSRPGTEERHGVGALGTQNRTAWSSRCCPSRYFVAPASRSARRPHTLNA